MLNVKKDIENNTLKNCYLFYGSEGYLIKTYEDRIKVAATGNTEDMMNIAVHPDYRMRGIGKALINELIPILAARNVLRLALEVRVSNETAIGLYKKLGFEIVGRRPNYYRNPKEDAFIMRKELVG